MYTRCSDSRGFKTELVDQNVGEEAGFKSVTFKVTGENSYGWLKFENGVHRLVRISPFDFVGNQEDIQVLHQFFVIQKYKIIQ